MRDVFLLYHIYEYGHEDEHDSVKNLGIYTTRKKAEEAIERYYILPGFREYPIECFAIEEYFYDKDMWWNEGFFKWDREPELMDYDLIEGNI